MAIHVTGARGFLGSHVVEALRRRGAAVRALGRRDGDLLGHEKRARARIATQDIPTDDADERREPDNHEFVRKE